MAEEDRLSLFSLSPLRLTAGVRGAGFSSGSSERFPPATRSGWCTRDGTGECAGLHGCRVPRRRLRLLAKQSVGSGELHPLVTSPAVGSFVPRHRRVPPARTIKNSVTDSLVML
jgi:hypothetical protein